MKTVLKASMLALLLAITSCAHHRCGSCCGDKGHCSMKEDKKQCPIKGDEKATTETPKS